jgi:hypothetical protein
MNTASTTKLMWLRRIGWTVNRRDVVVDSTPHQSSTAWGAQVCRHNPELFINSVRFR